MPAPWRTQRAQEPARQPRKGPPDRQPHPATRFRGSIVAAAATGDVPKGPSTTPCAGRPGRRGSGSPKTVRGRAVQTLPHHPSCNVYHHRPESPCARQESIKYSKNAIRAAGGRPRDHRPMPMQARGRPETRFPPTPRIALILALLNQFVSVRNHNVFRSRCLQGQRCPGPGLQGHRLLQEGVLRCPGALLHGLVRRFPPFGAGHCGELPALFAFPSRFVDARRCVVAVPPAGAGRRPPPFGIHSFGGRISLARCPFPSARARISLHSIAEDYGVLAGPSGTIVVFDP